MRTQVSDSGGLISVESMLKHFGEDAPLRIPRSSNIAEKASFGIAPDIRFHHAKPDIAANWYSFPADFSPSGEFRKVGTIMRLIGALTR